MKKLLLIGLVLLVAVSTVFAGGGKQSGAAGGGAKRLANVVAEYNEWNHLFFDGLKEYADQYG